MPGCCRHILGGLGSGAALPRGAGSGKRNRSAPERARCPAQRFGLQIFNFEAKGAGDRRGLPRRQLQRTAG
ncbi:hypothetical protein A9D60_11785 [Leisingera sp. JC1]|nr:hypothetical protein A9D60_11785 [Leisingera sp. JC1]